MRGDLAQSIVSIGYQGVYTCYARLHIAHPHSNHINFLVLTLVGLETTFAGFARHMATRVDDMPGDVGHA